jgi:hypothetical protein
VTRASEATESVNQPLKEVRVELPASLCLLARCEREVALSVAAPVTLRSVVDAVEQRFPMLRGTIRDQHSKRRRPFIRYFACREDFSHQDLDAPLPDAIANGEELFMIVGAIAGG